MPTQDEVNAQHLKSAGVDPESLGQPYSEPESQVERRVAKDHEVRCQSWKIVMEGEPPRRCSLLAGHSNYHRAQQYHWAESSRVLTQAAYDDAVAEARDWIDASVEKDAAIPWLTTAPEVLAAKVVDRVLLRLGIEVEHE